MESRSDRGAFEPVPIHDIFVTDIDRHEVIGHNVRFYLSVDQNSFDPDRPPDRFIVAKLIVPFESLPDMIRKSIAVIMGSAVEKVTGAIKSAARLN